VLFDLTYLLNADDIEIEREDMFEHEQAFSFHESKTPRLAIYTAHLCGNRLCKVISTGHTISLHEPDFVTVLLPREGRLTVETATRNFTAGPGDLLLFTPNIRVTDVIPGRSGRYECDCALVAHADIVEQSEEPDGLIERRISRTAARNKALSLWRFIDHLFGEDIGASTSLDGDRFKKAANVLLTDALGQLVDEERETLPERRLPSRRDYHMVRVAEELMRERYNEPLSTREIAKYIGVSARRLQIAFENTCKAPPLSVLKAIRLEIAHQRILAPADGESVTSIAMECGFFHPGRFSRDYAVTFGEKPSESFRRDRA